MYNPKKAQVNEEELNTNNQLLIINTSEMIKEQNKGFDRVNKHWGTNIRAKLSEDFEIMYEGGNENADEI